MGTDDYKAAEAIRIKREADVLDQSVFGIEAPVTVAEAAVSYLQDGIEATFVGQESPDTEKWMISALVVTRMVHERQYCLALTEHVMQKDPEH